MVLEVDVARAREERLDLAGEGRQMRARVQVAVQAAIRVEAGKGSGGESADVAVVVSQKDLEAAKKQLEEEGEAKKARASMSFWLNREKKMKGYQAMSISKKREYLEFWF